MLPSLFFPSSNALAIYSKVNISKAYGEGAKQIVNHLSIFWFTVLELLSYLLIIAS